MQGNSVLLQLSSSSMCRVANLGFFFFLEGLPIQRFVFVFFLSEQYCLFATDFGIQRKQCYLFLLFIQLVIYLFSFLHVFLQILGIQPDFSCFSRRIQRHSLRGVVIAASRRTSKRTVSSSIRLRPSGDERERERK